MCEGVPGVQRGGSAQARSRGSARAQRAAEERALSRAAGKRWLSSLRALRRANANAEDGAEGPSLRSINFSKPVLMCVCGHVRGGRTVSCQG